MGFQTEKERKIKKIKEKVLIFSFLKKGKRKESIEK